MSNTNDTIESKQKSEMTKKVRSGKKTGVQKKIIIIDLYDFINNSLPLNITFDDGVVISDTAENR